VGPISKLELPYVAQAASSGVDSGVGCRSRFGGRRSRACLLAVSFIFVGQQQSANASPLLTEGFKTQLGSWLNAGELSFTNLYTKSTGDTTLDFHAAVDGQGATLTLLEALVGGSTYIIGGYNPLSWSSPPGGAWNEAPTDTERTAFIFNLTTGVRQDERLTADQFDANIGRYQTFNSPDFGPYFGAGPDLVVGDIGAGPSLDGGLAFQGTYGSGASCGGLGGINILGLCSILPAPGEPLPGLFVVGALEVYKVAPASVPEPTSLLLLSAGLASLALRGRKRNRSSGLGSSSPRLRANGCAIAASGLQTAYSEAR
jgi:PEP-CTERM motif-containing protein